MIACMCACDRRCLCMFQQRRWAASPTKQKHPGMSTTDLLLFSLQTTARLITSGPRKSTKHCSLHTPLFVGREKSAKSLKLPNELGRPRRLGRIRSSRGSMRGYIPTYFRLKRGKVSGGGGGGAFHFGVHSTRAFKYGLMTLSPTDQGKNLKQE